MTQQQNEPAYPNIVNPLDAGIGDLTSRLHIANRGNPAHAESIRLAAVLASQQLQRGHVCVDLNEAASIALEEAGDDEAESIKAWPNPEAWASHLSESPTVKQADPTDDAEDLSCPLVMDTVSRRVYLSRYWFFQQGLASWISRKISQPLLAVDPDAMKEAMDRLFPDRDQPGGRGQCQAAVNAVDRPFSVISGGPGTGKTTTVARLLALRLALEPDDKDLQILLMAPTGKAAQRLNESMSRALANVQVDDLTRQRLSAIEAGTIHRILGWTPKPPERGGPFRHNPSDPLDAAVVIVDEASMVDMALMYRLLSAAPTHAQVILMGDQDQLVSVEAGGVLSDLCGSMTDTAQVTLSAERATTVRDRTGINIEPATENAPLTDAVFHLTHSHRFDAESQLGSLARAIRAGDDEQVIQLIGSGDAPEIQWIQSGGPSESLDEVVKIAEAGFSPHLQALKTELVDASAALQSLSGFRVLCALRDGKLGVNAINQAVTRRLAETGQIVPDHGTYVGQPIMVVRNDYGLQLFNGDVGLVGRSEDSAVGQLSVMFEDASVEGGVRRVPPSLIPSFETCYAMTIHKSQGSEFHGVVVVLPDRISPLLTRELLYTGITRVADTYDANGNRKPGRLWIVGSEDIIRESTKQQIRRTSGLYEAIAAMVGQTVL